jgi:hypothetical protein
MSVSRQQIPLADVSPLERTARRTVLLRALIGALAVAAALVAVVAALQAPAAAPDYLPPGTDGLVVLDVSASISAETYRRIAATLEGLAASDGRYGLVLFSDAAYLALPPRSPAEGLRAFARFFHVPRAQEGGLLARPPRSPWTDQFSAGTRISIGLSLALDVVRREGGARQAVLLVSDLNTDSADIARMGAIVLAYRRAGIPLRLVPLNAAPEDVQLLTSLVGGDTEIVEAPAPQARAGAPVAGVDRLLVAAAVAFAACMAALVAVRRPLRWDPA